MINAETNCNSPSTPLSLNFGFKLILLCNICFFQISQNTKFHFQLTLITTCLTILWQDSIQRIERHILKQALVVHQVSVNPLSLSLPYLLPLLATLKTEIDRVCRLNIHTQMRFFFLTKMVHHLTQLPAIPLQTQVFFFLWKFQAANTDGGVQKQGWIFSISFSLRFISLSLSFSFHSLNLE